MNEEEIREPGSSYAAILGEANMPVAEMTVQELKTLIQNTVREVLQEILRDPDAGLELRPEFEARLLEAQEYVASGGRLLSMEDLTSELEGSGGV